MWDVGLFMPLFHGSDKPVKFPAKFIKYRVLGIGYWVLGIGYWVSGIS